MVEFSFIHTADLHLDTPFKNISYSKEVRELLLNASLDSFNSLIDTAIESKVDFLVFAGDIYDGKEVGVRSQFVFYNGLQKLSSAGISSYILLGNHDPDHVFTAVTSWPDSIYFFTRDQVSTFPIIQDGKELGKIIGRSFSENITHGETLSGYSGDKNTGFVLAIYHGDIGTSLSKDRAYGSCTVDDLLQCPGIDYWALGHLHQFQILRPENPAIIYPGTLQGRSLKPAECGEKGAVIVRVTNSTVSEITFLPLSKGIFHEYSLSLHDELTAIELLKDCETFLSSKKNTKSESLLCVRLNLLLKRTLFNLFSSVKKKNEFTEMLREMLWNEHAIFLIDTYIDYHKENDPALVEEVLGICSESLKEFKRNNAEISSFLGSLFGEERKLQSQVREVDESEIELEAMRLIHSHLTSRITVEE
jgi:DNA repair exonuclease SbcCD nuclease subunit